MITLLLSFILGFFAVWLYEFIAINVLNKTGLIVLGYRLHHSLYGLLFIALSVVNKRAFFLGFGVGVITQHTVTDGFRFVSKEV